MVTEEVLRVVLRVLTVAIGAGVSALLLHAVWLRAHRRRSARLLARGRAAVNALLVGDGTDAGALATLRALPRGARTRVVLELARSLGGSARGRLTELAAEIGVTGRAERLLGSRFWWWRLRGARVLATLVGSDRFVAPLLDDPHPAVQAQAAEWAGEHPSARMAELLLRHLPTASPMTRFAAQDSLLRIGGLAAGPLARHLAEHGGREVLPALRVACSIPEAAYAAPARDLCRDDDAEVRAAAAELLGSTGGGEGVELLVSLLDDPAEDVRAAAVGTLGRLGHWPAAARVAERLRDPSWDVRQAAGQALRALGSPGELMLRRYRADADAFAADTARRMLELPRSRRGS